MSLLAHLTALAEKAFADLGASPGHGEVVPSQRPDLAQFQCNGAMTAAKDLGGSPRSIAEAVAAKLVDHDEVAEVEVAGPGFINLSLTDTALADWAARIEADPRLGHDRSEEPRKVLVDYAGPNVAKAMHVGHLRATIIGDALARLFEFAGHDVIRDPHFGDWGFQMGLLLTAIADEGLDEQAVTLADLQRIYPEASERARNDDDFADRAREATVKLQGGDPAARETWRRIKGVSEESQREDFAALGVEFDLWYGESDVAERLDGLIARMEEAGVAETSDGALVIRVDQPDDNREWPPLILRSSAGAALYGTTDLATVDLRADDLAVDLMLYVVDHRQGDHFTQVFRAARKAGIVSDEVEMEHIGFGTMNGPDGRPFRTREGGVVRLADVISMVTEAAMKKLDEAGLAQEYPAEERRSIASQVGIAALKFGDLINNRTSEYKFDLDRFSSFEGKTGPYLQYACVRVRSILRKAAEAGLEPGPLLAPSLDVERDLILDLLRLPEVIDRSIELRAPNHVAEFAYRLATQWNRFYDQCHILSEPDADRRGSWLTLARLTERSLETLLGLLGISVPDRM